MAGNAFDDLPPENAVAAVAAAAPVVAASQGNAFDDLTPPVTNSERARKQQLPAVTSADRAQALASGVWRGGAYLAGTIPDVPANLYGLGKAAAGTAFGALTEQPGVAAPMRTPGGLYHYVDSSGQEIYSKNPPPTNAKPYVSQPTTNIPAALAVNYGPSPVATGIAEALDKNHGWTPTTIDRPDDASSRYLSAVGSALPGAAVGGGGTVAGALKAALGAAPSAVAGQAVTDLHPFQGDWANTLATAGAQLGSGAAAPMLTKALLRGPSGATTQGNIDAFNDAGAQPSMGQATGARRMQYMESALNKIPGGAGVLQKFAANQASDLGTGAQNTVAGMSSEVSPEAAGEAITQGITGSGGAVDQFRQQSRALFNAVDQHVAPSQPVPATSTMAALDRLTRTVAGADNISATLVNPKIASIRDAIAADLQQPQYDPIAGAAGGQTARTTLPYQTLSRVRSQVGDMIGGNELISGIPRAQLKQLYGGLSDDMQNAASSAGPQAEAAWNKAQDYYRTNIDRMDQLSSLIDRQGGPEAIYKSALSGTNFGASRLRTVLDSIGPDQRNTVAATVLDRMGKATPGNQNAEGSMYSPATFLTNWNRMSPEAKGALFGQQGSKMRDHLENMAGVAQNIKEGSKVFANPSGTAAGENQNRLFEHGVTALGGAAGGALLEHGWSNPGVMIGAGATAVGVPVTANLLAKALTSPTAVNWAARPGIGSSAQAASFSGLPANLSEQDRQRSMRSMLSHALDPRTSTPAPGVSELDHRRMMQTYDHINSSN